MSKYIILAAQNMPFLYLKVEECLDFCHENISAVVASPSNMGCLNDRLVGRSVFHVCTLAMD